MINTLVKENIPFLLISNFDASKIDVFLYENLKKENIEVSLDNKNFFKHKLKLKKYPQSYKKYKEKFDKTIKNIKNGNTYVLNLSLKTKIKLYNSFEEIYKFANAPFKLKFKDEFICFSPEKFIEIKNNKIYTYPMKGTIDANIANAKKIILNDPKEKAEHTMIVDLLRNDLSKVANNVKLSRFRYLNKIKAGERDLIQVSSKIEAKLKEGWENDFKGLIKKLLPAGSISGAPKKSTIKLIKNIEKYDRRYFTGIFGIFKDKSFNSAVMIRFIEKNKNNFYYKSGGGITLDSKAYLEYKECIDKIYIP